jgi:hypothetical protein
MNDIKQYEKQLDELVVKLKNYDGNEADSNYLVLKELFDTTYDSGVLSIYDVSSEELDEYKLELFTKLTLVSGTLAFLAIQILAANNIMNKSDYAKREFYYAKKCGIAINHLRAPITIVSGKKCDGGYKLNGTLTWASGYKIFDTLLIGFHCDGYEFEAMASFEQNEGFDIGSADETFVGFGLHTVNIELKDFFVKDEDIVSSKAMGNYTKQKSASKTVHFCIYALGNSAVSKLENKEFNQSASLKLEKIKDKFMNSFDTQELDNLRVELFQLVQNIVTTAMVLNGGKSILSSQDFQRYYRELIMFNSNGLNNTLKDIFKSRFLASCK